MLPELYIKRNYITMGTLKSTLLLMTTHREVDALTPAKYVVLLLLFILYIRHWSWKNFT